MQFEDREQRNERPKEASRNLPMAVLLVLVSIICALLYIGWKYMSDDTSTADELTTAPADSVANAINTQPSEEEPAPETEEKTSEALPDVSMPKVGDKKTDATKTEAKTTDTKTKEEKPKEEEKPKIEIPTGGETYTHTVGEGETFFGIANRFNVKKETLKAMNPNTEESGIKVGVTKLKVRIKAIHTVGPGDILRVVGKKYGVPVNLIMQANKKTKNFAERGEKLIIPYAQKE
ncbi:LysM peptidoglycan-binding domain-containing protein [Emticicia agri]|uniref:LysM peptidoglycan-binding domain-containing protein n=1 Tax=Emticicia agri TaxID=2492393 RepID=A0A4Q5M4Y7_9BACT|nr:LysM domain-containing protein [Emticicia agri]RYU97189.1 LysM peptidoglycan-binding domain-containing protein [Emticicia agri]